MPYDKQLQQAVLAEPDWQPSAVAAHIGVTANAWVATLADNVESFAEKYAAETATCRVQDVKARAGEIKAELPSERIRGDGDIATYAIERLAWDTAVPPDAVTVKVEQGSITRTRQVPWLYQKQADEQAIARLHAVTAYSTRFSESRRSMFPTSATGSGSLCAGHGCWTTERRSSERMVVVFTWPERSARPLIVRWPGRLPRRPLVRAASRSMSQIPDS